MANVTINLNDEDISDLMLELATLQKHADELLSDSRTLLREMGELTSEIARNRQTGDRWIS
tara:strand:- start:238 stop:420 length:183 start_codon:yes stop_codon:yes gene_type:complete